jgi:hypothetical protein
LFPIAKQAKSKEQLFFEHKGFRSHPDVENSGDSPDHPEHRKYISPFGKGVAYPQRSPRVTARKSF